MVNILLLTLVVLFITALNALQMSHLGPVAAGLSCLRTTQCASGLNCYMKSEAYGRCL
jgi:hypothetical protein